MDYNKIFYAKRNGNIVACKFKELHFWFDSICGDSHLWFNPFCNERHPEKKVSYVLELADGTTEMKYYSTLKSGRIAESVEDCINEVWIGENISISDEICQKALGFVPDKVDVGHYYKYTHYYAWIWGGTNAIYVPLGAWDSGECRSTAWYNALTEKFEIRKHYKTEKECIEDNKINVIDFNAGRESSPTKKTFSIVVQASRVINAQGETYDDALEEAHRMLKDKPLGEEDIDYWNCIED